MRESQFIEGVLPDSLFSGFIEPASSNLARTARMHRMSDERIWPFCGKRLVSLSIHCCV